MEIVTEIPNWLNLASLILTALTLAATALAQLLKNKAMGDNVGKFAEILFKVIAILPTLGVNPKTKAMQEQIKELQAADAEPVQK